MKAALASSVTPSSASNNSSGTGAPAACPECRKGTSGYSAVGEQQRRVAAIFAAAGYDLVIGHHPHLAQDVDIVDGMPVIYSLGNFVFGSPGRYTKRFPGYSLVARTYLGADGLRAIELSCIVTDNDRVNYQPRPCTGAQAETLMRSLGPHVTVRAGKGLVEWPNPEAR